MSRTPDKIHIAGSDGREWLFERNSIDPRRVSAALIEHSSKTIVLYDESDLRISLGIRGWADVLTLGFDSQLLARYKRTQDARTIDGIRFVRYASTGSSGPTHDVWWSDEQVLPSRFATADDSGTRRFALERAKTGVDATVLAPAPARFPSYRVIDLAGWLEKD